MRLIAFLISLCIALSLLPRPSFASPINALESLPKNTDASVVVTRLSDGKTLFELNPDLSLSPASVSKILTAATALSTWGPAFTFKTRLLRTGPLNNGKLSGNLVVIGDGDPFLVSEKLWQMAADLRNMGLREIRGDIVIDNSLFDAETRDASRDEGATKSSHAYDAPVSALAVNFNSLAVIVTPGPKDKSPARVSLDPLTVDGVRLVNHVRTVTHGKTELEATRVGDINTPPTLIVSGTIALTSEPRRLYRSISNPLTHAGSTIRAFMKDAGIRVTGRVVDGRSPANATPLLTIESYPMTKVIDGLNKFSNNFIADMLVKRLGAKPDHPGSLASGLQVMISFLRDTVGLKGEFTLKNGSGLSIDNRLSARQVNTVLTHINERVEILPEFLASLPSAGVDGTLKRRFKSNARSTAFADAPDMTGAIRAKTGTLTEPLVVSSLAGYTRHPTHGMIAFTILMSGRPNSPQPAPAALRDCQEDFLSEFLANR